MFMNKRDRTVSLIATASLRSNREEEEGEDRWEEEWKLLIKTHRVRSRCCAPA
jgi:hypothetical protein